MASVGSVFVSNIYLQKFAPEVERILYSLQFLFADSITPLITDYTTKRYVNTIPYTRINQLIPC